MQPKYAFLIFLMGTLSATYSMPDSAATPSMEQKYCACECKNQLLLTKFNAMLNDLEITEKILLLQSNLHPSNPLCNAVAYFDTTNLGQVAIILMPNFFTSSRPAQDFILYHELRHYLQITTQQAQIDVQNIAKKYNLSKDQAEEYDADSKALEFIAKYNCPKCIQEIKNRTVVNQSKDHTDRGYITTKVVNLYLFNANKTKPSCDYH